MKTASTSNRMNRTLAGVAYRLDAALVRRQLHLGVAMTPHKPRGNHHAHAKQQCGQDLHQQRKILPVIGDHRSQIQKSRVKIAPCRLFLGRL